MQSTLIRKVSLGGLSYLVVLALATAFSIHEVTFFQETIAKAIELKAQRYNLINAFSIQAGRVLNNAHQYAFAHDNAQLADAHAALGQLSAASEQIDQLDAEETRLGVVTQDAPGTYEAFRQQRRQLIDDSQAIVAVLGAQSAPPSAAQLAELHRLEQSWERMTEQFESANQADLLAVIDLVAHESFLALISVGIFTGILALTLVFLLALLRQRIVLPIKQLATAARTVAAGDLTQTTDVNGTGEIGELQLAFNSMIASLREQRNAFEQRAEAEQARIAAEEASKAKSTFLANMSHELRTPLSSIIGYSELLQTTASGPAQLELLPDIQKIQQAGRHLLMLINDVLDLSKIEAGKMYLAAETFDVRALVDDVASTILPLVEKNHNRFSLDCAAGLGAMHSDPTKLRQVLLNLLSNAAKFTEHGLVTLAVARQPGALRFTVTDTGIGMSPAQIKRLFQPFTQATEQTTRLYGGTGLGLTLSQHLCRLMGGEISVSSQPGSGSSFVVQLPLSFGPALAARPPTPDAGAVRPTALSEHGAALVLVVDDDPAARDLITRSLDPGVFTVVAAANGEEGMQLARDLLPDVIILDVLMPDIDGWTVLAALKSDPALADIPVVMLTIVDDQAVGFALGASDYLIKPVERERLAALMLKYQAGATQAQAAKQVLLVEDDPAMRDLLHRTVMQSGCAVTQAASGAEALGHLHSWTPDLSIVDLTLPDMDGVQVIDAIRQRAGGHGAPIIVITAKDLSAAEHEQLNGSVTRILAKGTYRSEDLLAEVKQILAVYNGAATL